MKPGERNGSRATLHERRGKRWGYSRRKITTLDAAADWIDDVGFALLWPAKGIELPALWPVAVRQDGWGTDAERAWAWKDELPLRGRAWYGAFLRGRKGFLAPDVLADLYPHPGEDHDFASAELRDDARRIAEVILTSGPTSAAALRAAVGLEGKRNNSAFTGAVTELGRALLITHLGVEDQTGGWPSAMFELTARAFKVPSPGAPDDRRTRVAGRFLGTMLEADAGELAKAFGWRIAMARATMGELVARGLATRQGDTYHPA